MKYLKAEHVERIAGKLYDVLVAEGYDVEAAYRAYELLIKVAAAMRNLGEKTYDN